jgi:hypothetical protein
MGMAIDGMVSMEGVANPVDPTASRLFKVGHTLSKINSFLATTGAPLETPRHPTFRPVTLLLKCKNNNPEK